MIAALDRNAVAGPSRSVFTDGLRCMRDRLALYLAFAAACAFAAYLAFPRVDLYAILAERPLALVTTPPVSVVLALSLVATFFILPSALRRVEPTFRMTRWRIAMTIATIATVGVVTELGYAFAFLPGIVAAVLLSQTLVGALLRAPQRATLGDLAPTLLASMRGSYDLTRAHFVTTLGVVALSLCILLVPFTSVLLALAVLGVRVPASLVVTSPLLFLTFIYFECVRYALVVRWYHRLASEDRPAASP